MNLFFLILMAFIPGEDGWERANQDYRDGKYEMALDGYHKMVDEGIENGPLFFNLGNTYFKLHKMGYAVLYYEKARIFMAGDDDLEHNLSRALASRTKARKDPNADQMSTTIRRILYYIPYNMVFILTVILLVVAGIGWFIVFWRGADAKFRVAVSTIGLVSLLLMAGLAYQHHTLTAEDRGVILKVEMPVRSGPSKNEEVSFTIYEGKRVTILAKSNGWFRIRLDNGYNGWIQEKAVGVI